MFDFLRRIFGLEPRPDFWLEDSSMDVGVLVGTQLKEVNREAARTWGEDHNLILGYICGACDHLCSLQSAGSVRRALLPGMVISGQTGAPFEVSRDALKRAQMEPTDPGYLIGYRAGWNDYAIRRDKGYTEGLVRLLQGLAAMVEAVPRPNEGGARASR